MNNNEDFGDEDDIDVDHVNYTDDDYEDALIEQTEIHLENFGELLDSVHPIGSDLWKAEASSLFLAVQNRAKEQARKTADDRYVDQVMGY